jgi:uncharacterized protein YqeY
MIYDKIKAKSIEIRKAKGQLAAYSTFVLSEVSKIGKSKGDRETTDDEAITVLKKMLTVAESNLELAVEDKSSVLLEAEIEFLKSVLPSMATEEEVTEFLKNTFSEKTHKGVVFKAAKEKYGSLVDMMKLAVIAEELGVI